MKSRHLLLSAAIVAIGAGGVLVAHAQPSRERAERVEKHRIEHHERITRVDANNDTFITRAEAQAEAERLFAEMDDNDDGKLDASDHRGRGRRVIHTETRDGNRVETKEVIIDGADDSKGGDRDVVIHREVRDGDGHRGGRRGGHHMRGGPRGPMPMMIFAHSGEADRDNDGALSKSEFVTQQLRFFDAADANNDGKIKFEAPPMPPEPPAPPAPPQPPRK